jgi:hypothetical protein
MFSATSSSGYIYLKGFLVTGQILIIANHKHLTPAIGVKHNNRITGHMLCALISKANEGGLTNIIYHHMFTMSDVMHMPLNRPVCHDPNKPLKGPE